MISVDRTTSSDHPSAVDININVANELTNIKAFFNRPLFIYVHIPLIKEASRTFEKALMQTDGLDFSYYREKADEIDPNELAESFITPKHKKKEENNKNEQGGILHSSKTVKQRIKEVEAPA